MKRLLLPLLLILPLASPAAARQASSALTCAAARALVLRQGAVLFDTSATTFDRYVLDGRFCAVDEVTQPAWIPTRDAPSCFVGYTCEQRVPTTMQRF